MTMTSRRSKHDPRISAILASCSVFSTTIACPESARIGPLGMQAASGRSDVERTRCRTAKSTMCHSGGRRTAMRHGHPCDPKRGEPRARPATRLATSGPAAVARRPPGRPQGPAPGLPRARPRTRPAAYVARSSPPSGRCSSPPGSSLTSGAACSARGRGRVGSTHPVTSSSIARRSHVPPPPASGRRHGLAWRRRRRPRAGLRLSCTSADRCDALPQGLPPMMTDLSCSLAEREILVKQLRW